MKEHPEESTPWHTLDADAVCERLQSAAKGGLSAEEVEERRERFGPNEIKEKRRRPVWRMLLDQFADFMILVLIAAAVVSGIVGEPTDAVAIVVIIVLNAVIGFVQEYRAERAVAALKQMAASEVNVRREGQIRTIPAPSLVPGDIVLLEAGNVVPADLRLLEVADLKIDEAALTGESVAINKITDTLEEEEAPLGDRFNLGYKGTLVTNGRGTGVVCATGMATEIGKIATLLESGDTLKTPLQKRLAAFGRRLAIAVLVICALIFGAGLLRGEPAVLMFLTAVSLAVAAIPEALPAVVTVSLALGARKMVRHRALIRRLPAVETLGSVTTICSDKTGTLTQNIMRAEIFSADGQLVKDLPGADSAEGPWRQLAHALSLSTDAEADHRGQVKGDPTEVAFFKAARARGFDKADLLEQAERVAEIPFDADRKRMTTFHRSDDALVAYTKGAPEQILAVCSQCLISEGLTKINAERLLTLADKLAAKGYRVLAFARREWSELPTELNADTVEKDLTLIGLVGLIDPPRPEARAAVEQCKGAGMRPIMITGDHPATAKAIASRLGITDHKSLVVTGREMSQMSDDELDAEIEEISVFARVSPQQKIRIVKALQQQGEFAAMTGDGVNDAPALKQADIGVAMGQKGTDVAREAADMVLLDDNFATIVTAVREGRRIYDNIRKFIKYTMTSNSGEIWTLFLAPFLGLPIPLLPIHILWVNLVTDGLPGLALALEKEERGVMRRPPRPPGESVFVHGMWQHILVIGLLIGGLSLFAQAWAIDQGSDHWRSMTFTVLTLSQLVHVLVIRSERDSLFTIGLLSNRPLIGALVLTVALQLATLYVPFLNPIFKTKPLTHQELIFCLLLPLAVFVVVELEKLLARRGWIYRD